MKVLQINATVGYKSTGLIVSDIGNMLEKNGAEAFYAYQSGVGLQKNSFRVGNKFDWKLHALLCRVFGKQAYFSKKATKKLIRYITSIKPDIVHLHNLHSNYIHLNFLLSFLAKSDMATVITMHDCWYFTGKCYHYADIGCDKFKTTCGNCPKNKTSQKSMFFDSTKKVLKDKHKYLSAIPRITLVGCSKWICNEVKKSLLKDLKIENIYNGVDTEIFKPYDNKELREKYNLKDNTYLIMGMANKWLLCENKELLNKTIELLNDNKKLMLVGCSDIQIESLKGMSEHIIPVGFIKERELLAKHYSLSNVFVNPTNADTLPTVNMESICCGTPVITYNKTGSPELVLSGCGKVIEGNDLKSMFEAIENSVEKIDEKSFDFARDTFDKNKCYEKYLKVYNDILANGES